MLERRPANTPEKMGEREGHGRTEHRASKSDGADGRSRGGGWSLLSKKHATSLVAGCMFEIGVDDEERQSVKSQSVTTEISTRRLVDFDDLGSFGP